MGSSPHPSKRNPVTLGVGRLTWSASERVHDRYGTVWLMPDVDGCDSLTLGWVPAVRLDRALRGQRGQLRAEVLATRRSTHVGDLTHGWQPTTPAVGEVVVLGAGELFFEPGWEVGLRPGDGRATFWLDPRALYRVHEQTVRLWFEPGEFPDAFAATRTAADDRRNMMPAGVTLTYIPQEQPR
jgi:hypothetical protein